MIFTLLRKNSPPLELRILKHLQPRMSLSAAQKLNYKNLKKGYEGEQKLQAILEENLSPNYLMINDLLLQVNQIEFQIDTLLIGKNMIYLLEVKNYEGDFYIEKGNWYSSVSNNEISNPLHQLKRTELLLRKFLQHTRIHFSIKPQLIFINPEFYLYKATSDLPIIYPTQINRFIKRLNTSQFSTTHDHTDLAQSFIDYRLDKSTNERLPDYKYEGLRKGAICESCSYFLTPLKYKLVLCKKCSNYEDVESAVKRSINEFKTLFPDKKITTNVIYDWCQIIQSKKTIRRILKKYMNINSKGRHTYYTHRK